MKIVLASASPRRRQLLKKVFDTFEVCPTDALEVLYGKPSYAVMRTAKMKAMAYSGDADLVIASDTTVYLNGEYLGKPVSRSHAIQMLSSMSNTTHRVYTGVCIKYKGKYHTFYDCSMVRFRKLPYDMIVDYVNAGNSDGKAGSYGIQDGNTDDGFVKYFKGSYDNIVGLPTEKLIRVLNDMGIPTKEAE